MSGVFWASVGHEHQAPGVSVLKLRDSKQEYFGLVARVDTAKGRELDPS